MLVCRSILFYYKLSCYQTQNITSKNGSQEYFFMCTFAQISHLQGEEEDLYLDTLGPFIREKISHALLLLWFT